MQDRPADFWRLPLAYSIRKACKGSIEAARRAGIRAATKQQAVHTPTQSSLDRVRPTQKA
jgi:hypothetical protein